MTDCPKCGLHMDDGQINVGRNGHDHFMCFWCAFGGDRASGSQWYSVNLSGHGIARGGSPIEAMSPIDAVHRYIRRNGGEHYAAGSKDMVGGQPARLKLSWGVSDRTGPDRSQAKGSVVLVPVPGTPNRYALPDMLPEFESARPGTLDAYTGDGTADAPPEGRVGGSQ